MLHGIVFLVLMTGIFIQLKPIFLPAKDAYVSKTQPKVLVP
jgi:hypothetical protein